LISTHSLCSILLIFFSIFECHSFPPIALLVAEQRPEEKSHPLHLASIKCHADSSEAACYSADGELVASCARDGVVRLTQVNQGFKDVKFARVEIKGDYGTAVAISPDVKLLAVGLASSSSVRLYKITKEQKDGKIRLTQSHEFTTSHPDIITNLFIGAQNAFIATSSRGQDTAIHFFTLQGQLIQTINTNQLSNNGAAIHPDGTLLAVGTQLSDVKVLEAVVAKGSTSVQKVQPLHVLKGHSKAVSSASFGSNLAVTGCKDGAWFVWDLNVNRKTHEEPRLLATHKSLYTTIDHIALADSCLHPASSSSPSFVAPTSLKNAVIALTSGSTLAFYRGDGQLLSAIPSAHKGTIRSLAFNPDGARLATVGGDKFLKMWTVPSASK